MIPPRSDELLWIRKLDGDMHVLPADKRPSTRWYPGSLNELLWIVTTRLTPDGLPEAHACGSHWAMSTAAATGGEMVETSTPVHETTGNQAAPRLNNVLYDVIPDCMTQPAKDAFRDQIVQAFDPTVAPSVDPATMQFYLFHVEAGMRIYELYSFMDSGLDGMDERSLATWVRDNPKDPTVDYGGPWALETMGGAGGQTIVGAASTATHGGDVKSSSISDAIVALHLIAPDGQEYWIERNQVLPTRRPFHLVDEDLLHTKAYPVGDPNRPGGAFRRNSIIVERSDDLINAAIVACGRMGIIYSVVVRGIRQFALEEKVDSTQYWHTVKTWLTDTSSPTRDALMQNHFVRVDIDVYPKPKFDWHTVALMFGGGMLGSMPLALVGLYAGLDGDEYRCWIHTRALRPLAAANVGTAAAPQYFGRAERAGDNQGVAAELESQQDPPGNFRDPCASANWLRHFLQDTKAVLGGIRNDALITFAAAQVAATAAAFIGNLPLLAMLRQTQVIAGSIAYFCQAWILLLSAIEETLPTNMAFGDFISALLNVFSDLHAAALIQLMYWAGSNSQHNELKRPATSYAVMDRHNYLNKGCVAPGDSIEFFIDGTSWDLVSFIDYVLKTVRDLAAEGKGFGGYISLRFMTSSPSVLAMQRWPSTCSIEIAGLSKANGTGTLMERIEEESGKREIILHWGQRNNRSQEDVEKVFSPLPGGPLYRWRDALSLLTKHGRLSHFSTRDSRYKGLEITVPRLYSLAASMITGCEDEMTSVDYDAWDNPPGTVLSLTQVTDAGAATEHLPPNAPLKGFVVLPIGRGRSTIHLHATRELNENRYEAPVKTLWLRGFARGDAWRFQFQAQPRMIDNVVRWFVEINLNSQFISNKLRVSSVRLVSSAPAAWLLRNGDLPADVLLAPTGSDVALPAKPLMNRNWRFFSQAAVAGPQAPTVDLYFTLDF